MVQAKLTAALLFLFLDADNEAAHTLTEAYRGSNALYYNHQNSKDSSDTSFALFKAIIRSLSLASRDFAMQVEGCKGVILWSSSKCENQYKALKWKLPMILGLNKALVSSNSISRCSRLYCCSETLMVHCTAATSI